jgi:hypothetical protein
VHNFPRISDLPFPRGALRRLAGLVLESLVLEEVVKRSSRIIRTLTAFAGRFFFNHHTYRIELAVVAFILGRNSGGNGLVTFEAARRIKVFTLFAGVQSEGALRALRDRIGQIL